MKRLLLINALLLLCELAHAQSDAALIEHGRALYFGTQAFAKAPRVADAALPTQAAACVSCHGALGEGSREAASAAPAITQGPLRDHAVWANAAQQGKSHDGRTLNRNMPRYELSERELAALSAYAALIGTEAENIRGVKSNEILFGVTFQILNNISANKHILTGVEHAFAEVNAKGGVHGRFLKAVPISSLDETQDVFALVASALPEITASKELLSRRLPNLAAIKLTRNNESAASWTVPLMPSLQEQARVLLASLNAAAETHDCTVWLLDSTSLLPASDEQTQKNVRRFNAIQEALATPLPTRLCLGLLSNAQDSAALLAHIKRTSSTSLAQVVSLASLAPQLDVPAQTERLLVLPTPEAVVRHAEAAQQAVWQSLGEAAGNAVAEALARSGRLLQPERVLAKMRELSGFAPLKDAPLAQFVFSRTHAHGWEPAVWRAPYSPELAASKAQESK